MRRRPTIFSPLPDVAYHVVQTKIIRFELSDRRKVRVAIAARRGEPGERVLFSAIKVKGVGPSTGLARTIAPEPRSCCSGSRCIFPFGFTQEAVALS